MGCPNHGGPRLPRTEYGRELWDRMVGHVRDHDPFDLDYECGEWTIEKLFILSNYLAQVTQAMKGNSKFSSLVYVDLFASSGVCRVKSTDRRYPGSALLAAGCAKPFDRLLLVDKEQTKLEVLSKRIDAVGYRGECKLHVGDANAMASKIAAEIPARSLTVAFVDPFSLDIQYDAIAEIAKARPLDLIILFADDTDLLRNVEAYYYANASSKLDSMLGSQSDWRTAWDALEVRTAPQVRQLFADIYRKQLRSLGYDHSDTFAIPSQNRPMYRLVYASKHQRGLQFWRIACNYGLDSKGLFSPD